jgi:hypothetical protein
MRQHLETMLADDVREFSPEEINHLAEAIEKIRNVLAVRKVEADGKILPAKKSAPDRRDRSEPGQGRKNGTGRGK